MGVLSGEGSKASRLSPNRREERRGTFPLADPILRANKIDSKEKKSVCKLNFGGGRTGPFLHVVERV